MYSRSFLRKILVIFGVFIAYTVHAEDQPHIITLQKAEEQAVEHNLDLLVNRLDMKISKADLTTASLRRNPVLGINVDPAPAVNSQYGFSLTIPLDIVGRRHYRIEGSRRISQAMEYDFADAVRRTLYQVRTNYYDLLEARYARNIAKVNYLAFQQLVDLNENRFRNQQISGSELARSQVAYRQAELQLKDTELDLKRSEENLRFTLGSTEGVSPAEELLPGEAEIQELPVLEAKALDMRPDLLAWKERLLAAKSNESLQKALSYPDLAVGFEYHYGNPSAVFNLNHGIPDLGMRNDYYGVFAQIPLPIFDRNQGEREKSRMMAEQSTLLLDKSRMQVLSEVRMAYAEYSTSRSALQEFQKKWDDSTPPPASTQGGIIAQADSMKKSAEFAYRSGNISLLEYLDAVRTYSDIYRSYMGVISRYNKSIAALHAAVGDETRAWE